MKRGNIELSAEALIKVLNLPEDFKFAEIKYIVEYNKISIYGYSEAFPELGELYIPFPQKWVVVENKGE